MAKFFTELTTSTKGFIEEQKMFFVATAPDEGRINLSPKGMDSLRCLDNKTLAYLDMTGSGNETSAHIQQNGRMTMMFCSYTEKPLILRLYGQGEVVKMKSEKWNELAPHFPNYTGSRQIIVLHVDSVQTSCGFGIPIYDYKEDRTRLTVWTKPEPIEAYWKEKNQTSIDGLPTNIL